MTEHMIAKKIIYLLLSIHCGAIQGHVDKTGQPLHELLHFFEGLLVNRDDVVVIYGALVPWQKMS